MNIFYTIRGRSDKKLLLCALLAVIINTGMPVGDARGQCAASLSANNTCLPAILKVEAEFGIDSIQWYRDGSLMKTNVADWESTGITAAGGNGTGSGLSQVTPSGVYVDAQGVMYILDAGNQRVIKWLPGADSGTVAAGGNGTGSAADQLKNPTDIWVDKDGNVYVVDAENYRIQKWAPGALTGITVAGGNGSGSASNQLGAPRGCGVDAAGNLYVTEYNNHRVTKWVPGADTGIVVAGGNGAGTGANQMNSPGGLWVAPDGTLYIAETGNRRIARWLPGAVQGTIMAAGFTSLAGVCADREGNVYGHQGGFVATEVKQWRPGGPTDYASGRTIAQGNGMALTTGRIALDSMNNLYIGDGFLNARVVEFRYRAVDTLHVGSAGAYTARVSGKGCNTVTSPVTLRPDLFAVAEIITADSLSLCSGPVVLEAKTGAGFSYQWKKDNQNIPGAQQSSYSVPGAGRYSVEISDGTCTSVSDPKTVLSLDVSLLVVGLPEFCRGTKATLRASQNPGLSFTWEKDGITIPGAQGRELEVSDGGLYRVLVSNGPSCTIPSATIPIIVHENPTVTAAAAGPTLICRGDSVTLIAAASAGVTYQWRRGSFPISGETDTFYKAPSAGAAQEYSVVVTDSNGCTAYSTPAITVPVGFTQPDASVTALGPAFICNGDSVVLKTNPAANLAYEWRRNDVLIPGAADSVLTVSEDGAYTVKVTQQSGNHCSRVSSPRVITVYPLPPATISPVDSQVLCPGDTILVKANPGTAYSYQWMKGGTPVTGAEDSAFTITGPGSYNVKVTDNATNGCSALSDTLIAYNDHIPAETIPAGTRNICEGDTLMLHAGKVGNVQYVWFQDGIELNSPLDSILRVTKSGTYLLVTRSPGGCVDTSDPVIAKVHPLPEPEINYIPAAGGPELFTGNFYMDYQWNYNGQPVGGAVNDRFRMTAPGEYSVTVTDSNGCSATSKVYTYRLGIGNVPADHGIIVYPNPSGKYVHVSSPSPVKVYVSSLQGRLLKSAAGGTPIDIRDLPGGIYLVRVEDEQGNVRHIEKLIKLEAY